MSRQSTEHHRMSAQENRQGFALIVALVCMGFIVLLMLSLSTLSITELMSSQQQETQTRARANALLGLHVALGELQRTLGPDDRISAPATILDSGVEGRAHWTGAWQSNPNGGAAGGFLGWLVSVPDGADANDMDLASDSGVTWATRSDGRYQPTGNGWVAMVSDETVEVTTDPDGSPAVVMAGVVSTGDRGHYAWWVGDEGVKARVNLPSKIYADGTSADLPENLMSRLLSPQHYGLQKVGGTSGSDQGPLAMLDPEDSLLAQMLTLEDLDMLPTVNKGVGRAYYHDLTPNSQGLLTDTRKGGFRSDLTHLFEHNSAFNREFGADPSGGAWDSRYVFTPPGANISFSYGAPNWGILRSFYRLPSAINNNGVTPMRWVSNASNGTHDGKMESTQKPYQHPNDVYHINSAVHPLLSWYQLSFSLEFIQESQADGSVIWKPRLHIRPLVALYNPYDIHLKGQPYSLFVVPSPLLKIQVGNQEEVSMRLSELGKNHYIRIRIPSSITDLRPGETRIFGLDGQYRLSEADSIQGSMLKNDNDKTASYYVDLSVEYGSGTAASGVRRAYYDGATSRLYHYDNNDKEGSRHWGLTPAERARLTYVRPASAIPDDAPGAPPYPVVRFTVSFQHDGNAEVGDADTGGRAMLRFSSKTEDIVTLMNHLIRTDDPEMRPQEVVLADDIRRIGMSPDLFWFGMGMSTTDTTQGHLRQFVDANPRFVTASLVRENKDRSYRKGDQAIISGWTGASIPDSSGEGWLENWSSPDDISQDLVGGRYIGYFGNSRGTNGSSSVILYHVPREAPRSLGLFQHAPLGRYSHHQGYIVGNSYAPPRIDPAQIKLEPANGQNVYDWSYAVNLELWDKYFLSTIPQNLDADLLQDYLSGKEMLPNSRLRLTTYNGVAPTESLLTDAANPNTASDVAKYLVVDGAFNVNSTSVEAWKALLASNANLEIPIYNPQTGGYQGVESETDTIIYRTPNNFEAGADTDDTGRAFWSSYRRLSDDELTDLAEEIVKEVKARGPFGSLADFINRRPGSSVKEQRLCGALQAALDRAINKDTSTQAVGGGTVELADFATGYSTAADRKGTGAPGWVLQGDLLQAIGPLLSARSDTFVIRAYGDATDFRGNKSARAWCEAVVQRVAEDADGGLGRRFVVSSFRWIDAP